MKKRERQARELDAKKRKLEAERENAVSRIGAQVFQGEHDSSSRNLVKATTGLMSVEEYKEKREFLQLQHALEAKQKRRAAVQERKKRKRATKSRLSFLGEEDEEEDDEQQHASPLGKDPSVETSFLPDEARDEEENRLRQELALKWKEEQERVKQEPLAVTYSFWNGSGHRQEAVVKKGDTVEDFLKVARMQHDDLKGLSIDRLMFVKEDCIVPLHFTFYELIATKARGKTGGPLFDFRVVDDVLELRKDAAVPTDVSHPAKVMSRSWYDRNKHIFPASRWVVYDPTKQ